MFIAATRQNDGKTVLSIGLLMALRCRCSRVGFMKPVGQKYILVNNRKVDKDAVLVKHICGFPADFADMNPIAVEEGFTRSFLDHPDSAPLLDSIRRSYERIASMSNVVVIEGTGHAGVGSVFDLNNATVAAALDAPVVLITIGGIGRPVDEVALNCALLRQEGCSIRGVIVNKVLPEKAHVIRTYLQRAFDKMGLKLLGLVPYVPDLAQPNLAQIRDAINGTLLAGAGKTHRTFRKVIVGAMTARHALDYFEPGSLLVTPGDREDLILAVLSNYGLAGMHQESVIGMVLTGGLRPHKSILNMITRLDFPTLLAGEGTYEVTSRINNLVVKIQENDAEKIRLAARLVEEHVDLAQVVG